MNSEFSPASIFSIYIFSGILTVLAQWFFVFSVIQVEAPISRVLFILSPLILFIVTGYRAQKGDKVWFFIGLGFHAIILIQLIFWMKFVPHIGVLLLLIVFLVISISLILKMKQFLIFSAQKEREKYQKKEGIN